MKQDFTRIDQILGVKNEVAPEKLAEISEILLPRLKDLMFENADDERSYKYTFNEKDPATKGQLKWAVALLKRTENGFVSKFVPEKVAAPEEINNNT